MVKLDNFFNEIGFCFKEDAMQQSFQNKTEKAEGVAGSGTKLRCCKSHLSAA